VGGLSIECERARLWASLGADGELTELESAALAAHLRGCHDCAAAAAGLDRLAQAVRALPLVAPSRPLLLAPHRRRYGRLHLAASAAAVIAALAFGSLAGTLSSRGGGAPKPQDAASHRLQIQQSLLALMAGSADSSRPHGRIIPS
jgi:predicted anti-sigma-YlaC factor YlaD